MYNKASGSRSTVGGGYLNEASGTYSSVSGGYQNLAKTFGEFLGGIWSTIKEGNATTWIGTDRIFGIGNGKSSTQRSDAFNVYKNGVAELPSVTNALIDGAGAKTIPTKEWVQEQATDLSTGLEAIDEGNGIGWRLKGRNPDNYGNIGLNAIDLGASNSASTTVGATGSNSTVGGGLENVASGARSTVAGGGQNEANGYVSTVGGGDGNEASGNYSNVGGGLQNEASAQGSTVGGGMQNKASSYLSTVGGGQQNEASGTASAVIGGVQNLAKTFGEVLGGLYATIKEGDAEDWIGTDRIFGIGNGTSVSSRSDAFNVYKNGVAELPSVTNELIDLAGGKTIPTKEWVNSRNSIILVITPLGEPLTTGDTEYTFTAPYNFTLDTYWISAQVAPIGSGITVRMKVNGMYIDSIGTTIATGDYDSLASLPTITTRAIVKGDRITAEITAVGSTYEGEGLTLYLES